MTRSYAGRASDTPATRLCGPGSSWRAAEPVLWGCGMRTSAQVTRRCGDWPRRRRGGTPRGWRLDELDCRASSGVDGVPASHGVATRAGGWMGTWPAWSGRAAPRRRRRSKAERARPNKALHRTDTARSSVLVSQVIAVQCLPVSLVVRPHRVGPRRGGGDIIKNWPSGRNDLLRLRQAWLWLLSEGRAGEAWALLDGPNCYGIVWTPEMMWAVEETFSPAPVYGGTRRGRASGPTPLRAGPERTPPRRGRRRHWLRLDYPVPLNGEWSDLGAVRAGRPGGYGHPARLARTLSEDAA